MIRRGLVRETGLGSSNGGRPPVLLQLNDSAATVFGAAMHDYVWTVVATNLNAEIVQRESVAMNGKSPDAAVAAIAKGVNAIRKRAPSHTFLPAIGLGTPGIVDTTTGTIQTAVDVDWQQFPISSRVQSATGLQAFAANRSRVGALAELWEASRRGVSDLVYVSVGTGVAAGIIHAGQLYEGTSSSAGEIGHMTISPDGPLCECGNRGCLQQLVSEHAIAHLAQARSLSFLTASPKVSNEAARIRNTCEDVLSSAENGDQESIAIVKEVARYLSIAVGNLINLLNPELVVLGGPIAEKSNLLVALVQEGVKKRAMRFPLAAVEIRQSRYGSDASAVGAAVLVLHRAGNFVFSD